MPKYNLFSVIGIEIEYMLVDIDTLNIQPKSDLILKDLAGEVINEYAIDDMAISNELVLHVIELKNNPPQAANQLLTEKFQNLILKLQPSLKAHNLCLLPTASHPWMKPDIETKRWPYDNREIYQSYDKIFNCKGHGWSNLQSMHINLPFANDDEFNILHNSIRLILPLLPALAASSPIHEGKPTGYLDSRLYYYNINQANIPEISGDIIPEFISSQADYQQLILNPMYKAIKPHDSLSQLQYEWLNSRGAIPKFDYNAIEIRLLDTQECVNADLAIALLINQILISWKNNNDYFLNHPMDSKELKAIYLNTLKDGLKSKVSSNILLQNLQLSNKSNNCRDIWHELIEKHAHNLNYESQKILEHILKNGNLSDRILRTTGLNPDRDRLTKVYRQLSNCLLTNTIF